MCRETCQVTSGTTDGDPPLQEAVLTEIATEMLPEVSLARQAGSTGLQWKTEWSPARPHKSVLTLALLCAYHRATQSHQSEILRSIVQYQSTAIITGSANH